MRHEQPSFATQVVIGTLSVSVLAWIGQPIVARLWRTATMTQTQVESVERSVYYRNCDDAREAGAAPIYRGSPGYRDTLDGDSDGIACEPYHAF